jgi:hypothetical protein
MPGLYAIKVCKSTQFQITINRLANQQVNGGYRPFCPAQDGGTPQSRHPAQILTALRDHIFQPAEFCSMMQKAWPTTPKAGGTATETLHTSDKSLPINSC